MSTEKNYVKCNAALKYAKVDRVMFPMFCLVKLRKRNVAVDTVRLVRQFDLSKLERL